MSKTGERIILDPNIKSSEAQDFEDKLSARVVGQERAVRRIASLYQIYLSGMASPGRPIGNLLFLGPTGSGKTRVVEAAAEILFGDSKAAMKIDCAEFQHSHEIAKLIGSPPGYLGHRETPPPACSGVGGSAGGRTNPQRSRRPARPREDGGSLCRHLQQPGRVVAAGLLDRRTGHSGGRENFPEACSTVPAF